MPFNETFITLIILVVIVLNHLTYILDPTPRWSALRGSPELRPYNSLPRGQDITNYPSLTLHQTNLRNQDPSVSPRHRRSPTRRTQSEDVYNERGVSPVKSEVKENGGKDAEPSGDAAPVKRQVRVNPLMKLAETKQNKERTGSPKRKSKSEGKPESVEQDKGKECGSVNSIHRNVFITDLFQIH